MPPFLPILYIPSSWMDRSLDSSNPTRLYLFWLESKLPNHVMQHATSGGRQQCRFSVYICDMLLWTSDGN